MRAITLHLILLLACCMAEAREIQSTWIFVPDDSMAAEVPWRIIIYDDASVVSQTYFFGCKRDHGTGLKLRDGIIEIPVSKGNSIQIRKEKDRLVYSQKFQDQAYDCVFKENAEWNERFEKAPSPPKNRKEAVAVLDRILSQEDKDSMKKMPKEDLIKLHHGFGTGLRNGFGLWNGESQIMLDYGGGHPDDVSMKIIEEYWATLQSKEKPQVKKDGAEKSAAAPVSKSEGETKPKSE